MTSDSGSSLSSPAGEESERDLTSDSYTDDDGSEPSGIEGVIRNAVGNQPADGTEAEPIVQPPSPSRKRKLGRRRPYKDSDPKRTVYLRDAGNKVKTALSGAYNRAGVESLTVMFDPVKGTVKCQHSEGLESLARDLDLAHRVVVFWEYQKLAKLTQDYFSRDMPAMLEPLAFEDIPGGLDVQRQVTDVMLQMALPKGGKPAWIAKHTADQLRGMSSSRSKVSYDTWPKDVPLQSAWDMEPDHLAAAYKWAMRWLAAQDVEAVVTRITESRALASTGEGSTGSAHWHRCMALRLLRGVVPSGGASPLAPVPLTSLCDGEHHGPEPSPTLVSTETYSPESNFRDLCHYPTRPAATSSGPACCGPACCRWRACRRQLCFELDRAVGKWQW